VLLSSNEVEATADTTFVAVENGKPDDVEWDDIVVGIEPKKLVGMVGVEVLKVSSNFVLGKVNTTGASTLVAFPKCFPVFPLLLVVGIDLEEGLGGLVPLTVLLGVVEDVGFLLVSDSDAVNALAADMEEIEVEIVAVLVLVLTIPEGILPVVVLLLFTVVVADAIEPLPTAAVVGGGGGGGFTIGILKSGAIGSVEEPALLLLILLPGWKEYP